MLSFHNFVQHRNKRVHSSTSVRRFPKLNPSRATLPLEKANSSLNHNKITWLTPWAGKINWILGCDWLPKRWDYPFYPERNTALFPCNKSYIDHACSVKMVGYSVKMHVYGPWIMILLLFHCSCIAKQIGARDRFRHDKKIQIHICSSCIAKFSEMTWVRSVRKRIGRVSIFNLKLNVFKSCHLKRCHFSTLKSLASLLGERL